MHALMKGWFRSLVRLIPGRKRSDLRWWDRQASRYGPRSVLHSEHSEAEMAQVTEWQKGILFPLLRQQLRGTERECLDFGCGPGRFTPDLAELVGGRVVGVDPTRALLANAPRSKRVEYRLMEGGTIPADDSSVDVVWICLVLMCITDEWALRRSVAEIGRVLRPDGLLFLVENTESRENLRHLSYRSVEEYQSLFTFAKLEHAGDYHDLGERISILTGRKHRGL